MKEFVDAFKHLEKLCNDIYGEQHGVTLYIEEMEGTPNYMAQRVFGWDHDLKTLKRVRLIRNKWAHPDDEMDYTFEDIEFLKNFYNRVMNQQDPLAILRQKNKDVRAKNKAISEPVIPYKPQDSARTYNIEEEGAELNRLKAIAIFFIVLAAIIIVGALGWLLFS